jgi:hypothetical protein
LATHDDIGGKVKISLADMDLPSWEHDLQGDLLLIEACWPKWPRSPRADDAKLQHLKAQIWARSPTPSTPATARC